MKVDAMFTYFDSGKQGKLVIEVIRGIYESIVLYACVILPSLYADKKFEDYEREKRDGISDTKDKI